MRVMRMGKRAPLLPGSLRAQAGRPQSRAYLALAIGILCIGMSAIWVKWAGVPGPVAGLYRVVTALVVLGLPCAARQRQAAAGPLGRRAVVLAALSGVWFAGDLATWSESVRHTSAANATLIGNLAPLWVALGALLFWRLRLRAGFWAGLALALAGGAIIVSADMDAGLSFGAGDGLAILSSLFYAAYLLNTEYSRRTLGTLAFMWLSALGSTVVLIVTCAALGLPATGFSTQTYLALLGMGLVSHVGGWLAINYALGHLPAPLVSVTLLGQPVMTALLGVPLLGERLTLPQIGGGLIVLTGIYLANRAQRQVAPVANPDLLPGDADSAT